MWDEERHSLALETELKKKEKVIRNRNIIVWGTGVSRSLCKKGLPFLHKIKSFQSKSDSNVSLTCPNPR
jgi:hypothetical protein